MERRQFIQTSLASIVALSLSGVSSVQAAGTLKVGVLIPLSGPAGLFGPSCKNCTLMAIDAVNATGGILGQRVEPVFADVGGSPAEAVQVALKLWKAEGVKAFIGMHNSAVRVALDGVFSGKVPYVYTAVYEGGECSKGTFVLGETPTQQLKPVIPWLATNKSVKNWYLIGNDYNWPHDTNAAAKVYIKSSGGSVVGEEYLPFSANNFAPSLARIKSSGAEGVLITLVGGASVSFNRAFASFGLDDRMLRLGTLIGEVTLMGIGSNNSKDLFASGGYFRDIDTPRAKSFAAAYVRRFGKQAPVLNMLAESCYEGVMFLKALATRAGSLRVGPMEEVASGTRYEDALGATVVMHGHGVTRDIYLVQAKGTEFEVIKAFNDIGAGNSCS